MWPDLDDAVAYLDTRHTVHKGPVDVLSDREHDAVRVELFELAGRLWESGLVQAHPFDGDGALVGGGDRGQPPDPHAFLLGLVDLERLGRHPLPGAAVDHDGIAGTEPPGAAGDVYGGVAAAVDHHLAAQLRVLSLGDCLQHGQRVHHAGRVAGRDECAVAQLRADPEEHRVELP